MSDPPDQNPRRLPETRRRLRPYLWLGSGLIVLGIALTVTGAAGATGQLSEAIGIVLIIVGLVYVGMTRFITGYVESHDTWWTRRE